jgi:hypothetical protein
MFSFCDLFYKFFKDFDYVPNAFLETFEFGGTLHCM